MAGRPRKNEQKKKKNRKKILGHQLLIRKIEMEQEQYQVHHKKLQEKSV